MNTEQQIQSLQAHVEQLRMKVEELAKKVSGEETPGGPPRIVNELLEKLDKTKADAGIIIGSVLRKKHGSITSSMGTVTGFESWREVPDSYVTKIVQPFTDQKSLVILKAFLDGPSEKSKEELQEVSGIEEEELGKILMTLMELQYVECETKLSVKGGSVIKKDAFSLGQHGRDLLLVLLWRADEQRKYEEEGED